VGRAGLEPTTLCTSTKKHGNDYESLLERFREFELVDLRRGSKTIYEHGYYVRKFLTNLTKPIDMVTIEDTRNYLKGFNGSSVWEVKNVLCALKVFFRDFLGMPQVVQSFKFPRQPFKPKHILSREQLQRFYECLEMPKERALFLIYATSGLRRNEVLSLKPGDIDFATRMITPNNHSGDTKKSWLSFYNAEAEKVLNEYLTSKKPTRSERIFPYAREQEKQLWKIAKEETGLNITPQRLREWFCSEMLSLGVQDCYIDAFCGRVPKTILARHYTDYSPEKLKQIYEKANLRVLA